MAWLRVYRWESATWPEFRKVAPLTEGQATKLLRKLSRHFKTPVPYLRLYGWNGGGRWRRGLVYHQITLSRPVAFDTLLHEFAHHLNFCRNRERGHRRSFKRELKRTYTWARRYLPEEKSLLGLDALRRI